MTKFNKRISRRDFLRLAGTSSAALALGSLAPGLMMQAGAQEISGSIDYWHNFIAEFVFAGFEELLAAFSEEYPDIAVEALTIPNADFMTNFTTAVLGGSAHRYNNGACTPCARHDCNRRAARYY